MRPAAYWSAGQDVDELVLLGRGDHDGTPFGVGSQVLAGHDAPYARLAVRLKVDRLEGVLVGEVLVGDQAARVGGDDNVVCSVSAGSQS